MPRPSALSSSLCVLVLATIACGDRGGGGDENGDETSTGGEESGGPGETLSHGFVRLLFDTAEGVMGDPFLGTDTVIATLSYGTCLSNFYTTYPEMQQYGAAGATIFGRLDAGGEGWHDRLCAGNTGEHVDCNIVWITQQFDATQDLTVTYRVNSPLDDGSLLFGPLPTPDLASCAGDGRPHVELTGTATIVGKDTEDNDVWHIESAMPLEAATGDEDPILVRVQPVQQ